PGVKPEPSTLYVVPPFKTWSGVTQHCPLGAGPLVPPDLRSAVTTAGSSPERSPPPPASAANKIKPTILDALAIIMLSSLSLIGLTVLAPVTEEHGRCQVPRGCGRRAITQKRRPSPSRRVGTSGSARKRRFRFMPLRPHEVPGAPAGRDAL